MRHKTNRSVAILEVYGSTLLEVIMSARCSPGSGSRSHVCKIEEVEVSPDLQELSGPPHTWYNPLEDAKIIEIRHTPVEDQFALLIQSPHLREVPAGFRIPKLRVTHRTEVPDGEIRCSDPV